MTPRDDYLWDRSGTVDEAVAALERTLAPLAHAPRPLQFAPRPTLRPRRWPWLVAAAALLAFGGFLLTRENPQPGVGSAPRTFATTTDPRSVPLGDVATLDLAPDTEVRFEAWDADGPQLRLVRGTAHLRVLRPHLRVATGFGVAACDGGAFTLRSDGIGTIPGRGELTVQAGEVTIVHAARTALVPAGAVVELTVDGPGTPCFADADDMLRKAVAVHDAYRRSMTATKSGYLLVERCGRPADSLVLWHLMQEGDAQLREFAEQRLLELCGQPSPEPTKVMTFADRTWLDYLRPKFWRR